MINLGSASRPKMAFFRTFLYMLEYYIYDLLSFFERLGIFYCCKNVNIIRDCPNTSECKVHSSRRTVAETRRTIFIRSSRDACVDAVTSRRSIRRRCAVARSDGVGVLFPGWFEGLSRGGVAFPTTKAREYVLNRRGWGVSSSSSMSNIRKVTGDNFHFGFVCDEIVARGSFF